MSDAEIIRLRRTVHPLKFTGPERTYFEIVHVEEGIAQCRTESAAKILRSRGYEYADRPVPDGTLQPESDPKRAETKPSEGPEDASEQSGDKKTRPNRSKRAKRERGAKSKRSSRG